MASSAPPLDSAQPQSTRTRTCAAIARRDCDRDRDRWLCGRGSECGGGGSSVHGLWEGVGFEHSGTEVRERDTNLSVQGLGGRDREETLQHMGLVAGGHKTQEL